MDYLVHLGIMAALVGIPLALAFAYRRRHDGTTKAGVAIAGATVLGMLASAIALHYYDAWRERRRIDESLLHLNDRLCRSTGGDASLQMLRELSCGEGRTMARLESVDILVDRHDTVAGVMLPPAPPPGTTYVVWLVDDAGTPVAHLVLRHGVEMMSVVRDPGIARATGVQLTAETTVGNAPAAPVIASAPFAPL
jgi:hypothetical protein